MNLIACDKLKSAFQGAFLWEKLKLIAFKD